MSYLNTKVGVYTSVKSKKTGRLVYVLNEKMSRPLMEVLQSTDFVHRINAYRSTKKKLVKDQIGSFTPVGYYPEKRVKTVEPETQTGLIQIDIDGKVNGNVTDWPAYRDYLFATYPFIAVASLSCGGGGLYLLINTTGYENYERHFYAAVELLSDQEELNIDISVSSPNEIRYLALPSDALIRPDATVFDLVRDKPKNEFDDIFIEGNGQLVEVPQVLRGTMQRKHAVDFITRNLHNGVGIDQVTEYLTLHCKDYMSRDSHMYGDAEALSQLTQDLYHRYADQFNQAATPSRRATIHRRGTDSAGNPIAPQQFVHPVHDEPDKMMRDDDKLRTAIDFVQSRVTYDLVQGNYVTDDGQTTNPAKEYAAYNEISDRFTFIEKHFFSSVFEAGMIAQINSMRVWADSLPEWDGNDWVSMIASYLPAKDPQQARLFLTGWLIKAFEQATNFRDRNPIDIVNRWFLILHQHRENSGKTSYLQWLSPRHEWVKLSGLEESKDGYAAMARYMFVLDDELNGLGNFKQQERLKSMVSTSKIDVRIPYGKSDVNLQRVASFYGSTNSDKIFSPTEGNSRFLVIPLRDEKFNWQEYTLSVDRSQMWAQVKAMASTEWIRQNEQSIDTLRRAINADLVKEDEEYYLVSKYLVQDESNIMQTGEIIEAFKERYNYTRVNYNRIAQSLIKVFGQRRNGYNPDGSRTKGYPVRLRDFTGGVGVSPRSGAPTDQPATLTRSQAPRNWPKKP